MTTTNNAELIGHLTECEPNPWHRAGLLKQVALVRDFGDNVDSAVWLLTCWGCAWRETALTHAEELDKRLAHQQNP